MDHVSWENLVQTQEYSGPVCSLESLADIVQPGAHKSQVSQQVMGNPATY